MKVALFERIETILKELTINEGAKEMQQEKDAQKKAQEIAKLQTRNLDKLAVVVRNDHAISGDEQESTRRGFVQKRHVDEHQADEVATQKAEAKKGKEQEKNQSGQER